MDFLSRMTQVVDYIEEHITEDMDMNDMAKIVCCGVYQFGRIFSYVVGVSLSEYIRRRRLSLAAIELQGGHARVIDVALKYGYDSPDALYARVQRFAPGYAKGSERLWGEAQNVPTHLLPYINQRRY